MFTSTQAPLAVTGADTGSLQEQAKAAGARLAVLLIFHKKKSYIKNRKISHDKLCSGEIQSKSFH